MAVAAAIGVGSEEASGQAVMPGNPMANRLHNKMKNGIPMPTGAVHPAMGDINRSIEKMSLGDTSCGTGSTRVPEVGKTRGGPQTMLQNNRRDSSWTVSTEGYGSMRSNTSASRRCSELSTVSFTTILMASRLQQYLFIQ